MIKVTNTTNLMTIFKKKHRMMMIMMTMETMNMMTVIKSPTLMNMTLKKIPRNVGPAGFWNGTHLGNSAGKILHLERRWLGL